MVSVLISETDQEMTMANKNRGQDEGFIQDERQGSGAPNQKPGTGSSGPNRSTADDRRTSSSTGGRNDANVEEVDTDQAGVVGGARDNDV
jgi:hypothetical protein